MVRSSTCSRVEGSLTHPVFVLVLSVLLIRLKTHNSDLAAKLVLDFPRLDGIGSMLTDDLV